MSIVKKYLKRLESEQSYFDFQRARGMRYQRTLKDVDFDIRNKKILEVGCGIGGIISSFSGKTTVGLDVDKKLVAKAKKFARSTQTIFVCTDAERLPFKDETFDLILLLDVIEHMVNPEMTISECFRALRKGGLICINFPPYCSALGGHLILPYLHYLPRKISYFIVRRFISSIETEQNRFIINYPHIIEQHESLNRISTQELKKQMKRYSQIIFETATTVLPWFVVKKHSYILPEPLCISRFFVCRKKVDKKDQK